MERWCSYGATGRLRSISRRRGTPQESVLSPLLFNLALLPLLDLLKQIEGGVDHVFYTDDITLLMARARYDNWAEEVLKRAATTVHEYVKLYDLSGAPQKSELLIIQPRKLKRAPPPSATITIDVMIIKPTKQIKIFGLLLQNDGKTQATVTKIKTATEQILRMIRKVLNRNRGLQDDDVMRLVPAFVVPRVTYSAPYLQCS
ncbi:hypothetical protein HPB51_026459 [Rhipicephalus microplus]|uniref:Reverse transcriptase domain-containing protein n=1 Tax=Rhipicephalus microplus TaxID=6941 RepID=A0A9J6D3L2_RHIMP|nr:hypothetical protein HPB51_026459 [Rhipicephalus microplus]